MSGGPGIAHRARRRPESSSRVWRTIAAVALAVVVLAACNRAGDPGSQGSGTPAQLAADSTPDTKLPAGLAAAVARFRARDEATKESLDPRVTAIGELLNAGRFDQARTRLLPIVAETPVAGRARFFLGIALQKAQRYAEALPHFEAVLASGPRFPKAEGVFYFYAWALYWLGRADEAEAAFGAALEFAPTERDAWFGLGVCRLEQGALATAEEALRRALELATAAGATRDAARARARLADVHLGRDDAAAARKELEASVAQCPDFPEVWQKLARVLARLGDEPGAARARAEAERRAK